MANRPSTSQPLPPRYQWSPLGFSSPIWSEPILVSAQNGLPCMACSSTEEIGPIQDVLFIGIPPLPSLQWVMCFPQATDRFLVERPRPEWDEHVPLVSSALSLPLVRSAPPSFFPL